MINQVDQYEANVDEKWQEAYHKLLLVLKSHIPDGFELKMQYQMPTFVVPLSVFPDGYLSRKDEPLPFISLGAQKKYLALYHMGIMGNKQLLAWFQKAYQEQVPTKLNMGKSCIRFTNPKNIPYELIGQLAEKITVEDWVAAYQKYQTKKNIER